MMDFSDYDSEDDNKSDIASVNDNDERQVHSQPLYSSSYQVRAFKTTRDKFLDFLDIPLKPFKASPLATLSTRSRGPKFFDLHLHPALQLQKIVVVQDLPAQIAEVCRKRFTSKYLLHLPAFAEFPFTKAEQTRRTKAAKSRRQVNESTLAGSYNLRFGEPLSIVSSTLIFELNKWDSVFDFSLFVKEPLGSGLNFANPDGFLSVTKEATVKASDSLPLPEKDKNDIKLILKHNLNRLVLWEFKNLRAGSKAEMEKFVALEGNFTWSTCRVDTNGRNIGFDDTLEELDLDNREISMTTEQSIAIEPMDVDYLSEYGNQSMPMEMDQGIPSGSDLARYESLTTASATETTSKGLHTTLPKGLAAKKASITSRLTSRGNHWEPNEIAKASKMRQDHKDKTAQPQKPCDIAQQLWAEGVKHDATFLVLNSGNYEIICVRHRQTQTLYISPVFEVDDKIYKATQIGLHALAYSDALNRARQLEALESPNNQIPIPRFYDLELHIQAFPPVYQRADIQAINDTSRTIYKDLLEQLSTKSTFKMKLHQAKDYSTCLIKRLQSKTETQPSLSLSSTSSSSEGSWSMVMGKAISERVYSITVEDDQSHSFSDKLVIKLALNKWENIELDDEYECHHELLSSQKIGVKVFGILTFPGQKHLTRGLLMEWSGDTLKAIQGKPKLRKQFNPQSIHATKALKVLHKSGRLHGNLKAEHILLTEGDNVSFISYRKKDLGDSSSPAMKAAMEEEEEYIKSLY